MKNNMSLKLKSVLFLLAVNYLITGCNSKHPDNEFSFDKIYNYGIQEDVAKIVSSLNRLPDDSLTILQKEIKRNYLARFQAKTEPFDYKTQDTLIVDLLTIFHNYWIEVLMKNKSIKKSEEIFSLKLSGLIQSFQREKIDSSQTEDVFVCLSNLLQQHGYFSQIGRTGNIMDLLVWTKQTNETFTMTINDSTVNVQVVFIDSIVTLGWEEFATFGKLHPGGWTRTGSDSLYCVGKSNTVDNENFKVSFLSHEAQHLFDAKMYSGYSRWLTEYRAKLSELSVAENTIYQLIEYFVRDSKNDSRLTHPYAEYRVIEDLSKELFNENFVSDIQRWKGISFEEINRVSRKLLIQNSARLKRI